MIRIITLLLLFATTLGSWAYSKVIIISLDGCRWDYPQMYDTPFLDSLENVGTSGSLIPSFPSKTFPNHYALATGLRPEHHGIIANSFFNRSLGEEFSLSDKKTKSDPRFWGGAPIWVTAQKQGLHTAVFHWPGSDVKIGGMYPDKYFNYDSQHLTEQQRIDSIIAESNKNNGPQLIMAYFEQPDAYGHLFGPQSKRTRWAVEHMDSVLRVIYNGLKHRQQTNFIIVSDHGMSYVSTEHIIHPKDYLKQNWIKRIDGNLPSNIYATSLAAADSIVSALKGADHLRVWLRKDVPASLHYSHNSSIGDVVVLPDIGYIFQDESSQPGGTHGWDPALMDMHAVFRAIGPAFSHKNIGHFSNTAVYPLLCRILELTPAPNDGDEAVVEKIVK